mgnify:CR=1 FL=1
MKTINQTFTNEIIIEKSKFIGIIKPLNNKDDVKNILNEIKKEYPKATHYCYGYIVNGLQKSNDDGEPSSTAGKPILETLLKNDEKAIINPSIVASFSESYAFINGDNVDERISLESEFKKFYGERSGLVHGGKEKLTNASINPYEMITKTIRNVLINPKFCNCKNMSELALLFKQMKYSLSDDASK